MEIYLISLAVALVGGLMLSRLTKLINLPAVTAYLVAGLILGPFCLGALKVSGFGFNTLEQVETMGIVTQRPLPSVFCRRLSPPLWWTLFWLRCTCSSRS